MFYMFMATLVSSQLFIYYFLSFEAIINFRSSILIFHFFFSLIIIILKSVSLRSCVCFLFFCCYSMCNTNICAYLLIFFFVFLWKIKCNVLQLKKIIENEILYLIWVIFIFYFESPIVKYVSIISHRQCALHFAQYVNMYVTNTR